MGLKWTSCTISVPFVIWAKDGTFKIDKFLPRLYLWGDKTTNQKLILCLGSQIFKTRPPGTLRLKRADVYCVPIRKGSAKQIREDDDFRCTDLDKISSGPSFAHHERNIKWLQRGIGMMVIVWYWPYGRNRSSLRVSCSQAIWRKYRARARRQVLYLHLRPI